MKTLKQNEQLKRLVFLVKLETALRNPKNEVYAVVNGQVRRVK
jgi:hypothetical protein